MDRSERHLISFVSYAIWFGRTVTYTCGVCEMGFGCPAGVTKLKSGNNRKPCEVAKRGYVIRPEVVFGVTPDNCMGQFG